MWTHTVMRSQLDQPSRWKVEFFCNDMSPRPKIAFGWAPLRAIVDERKETLDPQAYPNHLFNYVGLEHVQSVTGDLVDFAPRYGKEIRSRSKVFREGDILYGRLRPYLNKVFLTGGRVSEGICSGEFYVFIPKADVALPNFLRAILASHYVQQYVSNLQTGSALPRLEIDELLRIEVPLPPLELQSQYEEFLIKETARRRRLAAELARLPQAILSALAQALESGDTPCITSSQEDDPLGEEEAHPLPMPQLLA